MQPLARIGVDIQERLQKIKYTMFLTGLHNFLVAFLSLRRVIYLHWLECQRDYQEMINFGLPFR